MRDDLGKWEAQGVSVALIGSGNATFAEAFREDFALDSRVLIDPDRVAYRAAGLRRGAAALASPRLLGDASRALATGARQSGVQGDPWQLGGVFVFAKGGDLRFAQRATSAGDHARPEEIEAALAVGAATISEGETASFLAPLAKATRSVLDISPIGSFDRIGFLRHSLGFDPNDLEVDLHGSRALVSGANSGIGFATAMALADRGAEVVLLCRSLERGEAAAEEIRETTGNRKVELFLVDMSDLRDVERAGRALSAAPVDILVHNAGVLPDDRIETKEGLERTLATHVAGPHLLTAGLRKALAAGGGARVVWVSSGGMLTRRLNLEDPNWTQREYDGVLAYAETKRAQVILAGLWAEELAHEDVAVNAMHPGWADTPSVATSLPRFHQVTEAILRSPTEGADTVVWLAASPAAEGETGKFFFDRQAVRKHWLPSTRESAAERARLWARCGGAKPKRASLATRWRTGSSR